MSRKSNYGVHTKPYYARLCATFSKNKNNNNNEPTDGRQTDGLRVTL